MKVKMNRKIVEQNIKAAVIFAFIKSVYSLEIKGLDKKSIYLNLKINKRTAYKYINYLYNTGYITEDLKPNEETGDYIFYQARIFLQGLEFKDLQVMFSIYYFRNYYSNELYPSTQSLLNIARVRKANLFRILNKLEDKKLIERYFKDGKRIIKVREIK